MDFNIYITLFYDFGGLRGLRQLVDDAGINPEAHNLDDLDGIIEQLWAEKLGLV